MPGTAFHAVPNCPGRGRAQLQERIDKDYAAWDGTMRPWVRADHIVSPPADSNPVSHYEPVCLLSYLTHPFLILSNFTHFILLANPLRRQVPETELSLYKAPEKSVLPPEEPSIDKLFNEYAKRTRVRGTFDEMAKARCFNAVSTLFQRCFNAVLTLF
jgi:hypothetical protein